MAIVGAGPIGLAALLTAQFYSPAEIIMIDLDDNRLEVAKRFGATATINSTDGKAVETVMKMTGGRGVDTAIEAVGIPATFELCAEARRAGRHHRQHRRARQRRSICIWRACGTATSPSPRGWSTPSARRCCSRPSRSRKIDPKLLITHRFKLDQILEAYETFGNAAKTKALKVIIEA